ncbi:cytochrome c [Mucilaginibacter sp. HMF5004]|uniref:c-type cytochrome n=1 Tax=Mucilaginibacter rivuli TaxID=2857527 RepID=UPI001C5F5441|nr:c-type cytochrome [Mucilaginibacter rivuli]MBW4891625.1 cytochrome c [Mucilaginibacter rivuli]
MKKVFLVLSLLIPFGLCALAQSKAKAPAGISPAAMTHGEAVYKLYCLSCHQADGGGAPNMNPPLVKTSYIKGDKAKLIKVILNGFPVPVDIDGQSYSNVMAPHNFLKDQEIADVLTYVRNSFGNKGTAITAAQVKAVRAKK